MRRIIREVSLITDRVDRDETYFPIMVEEEVKKGVERIQM